MLRALYSYAATNDEELSLESNDLVYLLETADDGWWTVKKRVANAASDEPQGLVPHNYVGPAQPESQAHALFDYVQQTDEEIGFKQGDVFDVYAPDGDWVLVGNKNANTYGFVPFNYLEYDNGSASSAATPAPAAAPGAVAVSQGAQGTQGTQGNTAVSNTQTHQDSEPEPPRMPQRPVSMHVEERPPAMPARPELPVRPSAAVAESAQARIPSGESSSSLGPKETSYEVQDVNGRRKVSKTLRISSQYIILEGNSGSQKWDIADILSYNNEKKHIFLELRSPRMSLDLKAQSQAEAERVVAQLGQAVGAKRGGGLEEVLALAGAKKYPHAYVLLDFKAMNKREVTVVEGESVIVLNDQDKDWWLVRTPRGHQGLVPRKFITFDEPDKELSRKASVSRSASRSRSRPKRSGSGTMRTPPETRKLRTWVDRSGSFRVEAQFLGFSDGKVHLHKENGVKIAVPASKLSFADLDYVESVAHVDLNEHKPLSDRPKPEERKPSQPRMSDKTLALCDWWLTFFLECRIDPQNANRYAKNFARDSMEESMLDDINANMLRTFGLREGDILRVMRRVNERNGKVSETVSTPVPGAVTAEEKVWQGLEPQQTQNQIPIQAQPTQMQTTQTQVTQPAPLVAQTTQTQPLVAQTTQTPQLAKPLQPQLTQPFQSAAPVQQVQQVQPVQKVQQPQPTGALADLLGLTPLAAQKTAEAQIAAQQRRTQQQILLQQAELQREQIRLLKEQQEQLRRQQKELIEIQRTGTQMKSLGPFATGIAQSSQFVPSAATVLAAQVAPQPPAARGAPVQSMMNLGLGTHLTGPFNANPQPVTSVPTGPFQQPVAAVRTGPFGQPAQPITGVPTGPFGQTSQPLLPQPAQPIQLNQLTGIQTGIQTGVQTGIQPMQTSFPTGQQVQTSFPTGQQIQPMQTSFQTQTLNSVPTGPFSQPITSVPTGPFVSNQFTGLQPQQQQQQPQQSLIGVPTGPFGQASQPITGVPTGPFSQQPAVTSTVTGPFGQSTPSFFPQPAQTQTQQPFAQQTSFLPQTTFGQPAFSQSQPQIQPIQPAQSIQQVQQVQPFGMPTTSFQAQAPQPQSSAPLQSQATGFGFGNQEKPRANVNMATAANPFGL